MSPLLQIPVLHRMGLTVLHALWEVALIALLIWVGLYLLRRRSAQSRYLLACGGLVAMVLGPGLTWFLITPSTLMGAPLIQAVGMIAEETNPTMGAFTLSEWLSWLCGMAPWAAVAWCAGFTLMLARLGVGLWWLDQAYLATAGPASHAMQATLNRLAQRMGVTQPVRLLESARAESPLLLGWLKPAILVPSAALLQLSPAALEAILAHELAHVRRFDYLVNLLQSLVEALLFFHPCAWWLSSRIRELREHCCDDAAASLCGDPLILAEGLSALERLRRRIQLDPEPALAAAKGNLMSRITRLFQPQETPAASLRSLALALLGAALLGAAVLTAQQATPKKKVAPRQGTPHRASDKVENLEFSQIKVTHQPPAPAYPAEARAQGIQGTVVVEITVDEQGAPAVVKALSGPEELRATAIGYAEQWRFRPHTVNGKPTKARFKLTMPFKLK